MRYVFANCILDTRLYSLHRGDQQVRLRPKVFQLLRYLLEHRDRMIPKQELCEQVWAVPAVSDATLENSLAAVRRAVGDSGRAQDIIQTRYGHGYRFVAPVTVAPETDTSARREEAAVGSPAVPQVVPSHGQAALPPVPALGEHKMATLLCCALADVGGEAGRDHAPLHHQAPALYDRVRQVAARYGGTVQPVSGACVLIVFGAPVAQEDHAQRAVFAATDLLNEPANARAQDKPDTARLVMRLSIHTGSIVVEGRRESRETTPIYAGTTASVALALRQQTPGGAILCSETTASLVRRTVQLEKTAPVPLEGQAMLLQVYRVVAHGGQRLSTPASFVWTGRPLVGRAQELATLYTRWTRVEEGHGQVVGIVGEPGMGKSRLLYEFRCGLGDRPHTYLQGRCLSFGQDSPYLPLLDVLRQSGGITGMDQATAVASKIRQRLLALEMEPQDDAPYLLHLLSAQESPLWLRGLSPETRKARTIEILLHLLWQTAQSRPLVIEIENLHWIDATSEALLAALAERLAGLPILLVVTHRPGYCAPWMAKSYVTQISLSGLEPDDSRRVVEAVLASRPIAETLLHEIIAKADGNPFFLEELARAVAHHKHPHDTLVVPDTIQTVLASRIDQLSPAAKRLLQIAAMIGAHVPVALLSAITSMPEEALLLHLHALQAMEFLTETALAPHTTYTFKHILIRETAYQSLLPRTRQYYHRQIAQVLSTQFPEIAEHQPEKMAHHYTEGGLPKEAIALWEQAGQRARQNGANVEAVQHFTNGLELLKLLPATVARDRQELALQIGYGTTLAVTKGLAAPAVDQTYTRALALCQQVGETAQLFPVLWGLRMFYMARGDLQAAHEVAQVFFARARQQQETGPLLVSHQALGVTLYYLDDLNGAQAHLEQMRALYTPQQYADHAEPRVMHAVVIGLCYDALVLWYLGYPERSQQRSHEALTLGQETADPLDLAPALFLTAVLHLRQREVDRVQHYADALIALATEKGFQYRLAQGLMMRGWSIAMQGQTAAGIAQIRQGLDAYEATGAQQGRYMHLMWLADIYTRSAQFDMASQVLTEALTAARYIGQRLGAAQLERRQGDLLLAQAKRGQKTRGPAEKAAEQHLLRALESARGLQAKSLELRAAMSLSRLWHRQGRRAEAHDLLSKIYAWFTEGFETADLEEAKALLEAFVAGRDAPSPPPNQTPTAT